MTPQEINRVVAAEMDSMWDKGFLQGLSSQPMEEQFRGVMKYAVGYIQGRMAVTA